MDRYAVFGILDDRIFGSIRNYQRDLSSITGDTLALRFPIHVTLRGPFRIAAGELEGLISRLAACCRGRSAFDVVLNGPVMIEPDLCWFEVEAGSAGFSHCHELHLLLEHELNRHISTDDVPANHKLEHYRPHVTLGWNISRAVPYIHTMEAGTLTGTVRNIALACYPDTWPSKGTVRVIESISLNMSGNSNQTRGPAEL